MGIPENIPLPPHPRFMYSLLGSQGPGDLTVAGCQLFKETADGRQDLKDLEDSRCLHHVGVFCI